MTALVPAEKVEHDGQTDEQTGPWSLPRISGRPVLSALSEKTPDTQPDGTGRRQSKHGEVRQHLSWPSTVSIVRKASPCSIASPRTLVHLLNFVWQQLSPHVRKTNAARPSPVFPNIGRTPPSSLKHVPTTPSQQPHRQLEAFRHVTEQFGSTSPLEPRLSRSLRGRHYGIAIFPSSSPCHERRHTRRHTFDLPPGPSFLPPTATRGGAQA